MNAGAHRRRATNFSAPALTWHRAFWIDVPYSRNFPDLTTAKLEDARKEARIRIKNRIDDFIVEFRKFVLTRARIGGTPKCEIRPTVGGRTFLFNRVVDSTYLRPIGDNESLSATQKDILYSDNRVVVMEFDWEGIDATARIEIHTEYFSITTIAELHAVCGTMPEFGKLVDYLESVGKHPSIADIALADSLRKFLFFEFWNQRVAFMAVDPALGNILTDPTFRNLFADFRGLVVSDGTFKLHDEPDFGQSEGLAWGKQVDFKLLPLFTEIERYECTASYMLDGRALYMTTLGPQLPEAQDSDLLPLQYIFYVHEADHQTGKHAIVSKWQLGRLVDRIHLLGTVRLASLKYLPDLREAGDTLSGLDGYVAKARSDQTGLILNADLRDAHKHFASITTNFNKGTKTDTGILYRIERARYYIDQFKANVEALRIRRLEGYQRYDEFVRHRLWPVFDFIDRLGIRYERAVGTLSLFDQFNLSLRTQQIDDDIRRGQDDIRKIQVYGEAILCGVLVPYYLTALADHVVDRRAMQLIAIGLFTLGVGYAFFRIADFKKAGLGGRIAAVIIGWLVVGLIVLGLHLCGAIKFSEATASDAIHPVAVDVAPVKDQQPVIQPSKPNAEPISKPQKPKLKKRRTGRGRHSR
jgi:hypothetical protein